MKRLYVLVRNDLPATHQAVQAGHAVAAWCLAHAGWENEVLIYLRCPLGEVGLLNTADQLEVEGVPFSLFREPDRGNEATALAVVHPNGAERFRRWKLLELGA